MIHRSAVGNLGLLNVKPIARKHSGVLQTIEAGCFKCVHKDP